MVTNDFYTSIWDTLDSNENDMISETIDYINEVMKDVIPNRITRDYKVTGINVKEITYDFCNKLYDMVGQDITPTNMLIILNHCEGYCSMMNSIGFDIDTKILVSHVVTDIVENEMYD